MKDESLTYKITIHSPPPAFAILHAVRAFCREYTSRVYSRPYGAKIAHLVGVPVSQSDLEQMYSFLRASSTNLCICSKSAVNSNSIR